LAAVAEPSQLQKDPERRTLSFTCNLCGSRCHVDAQRGSPYPNCPECGSTSHIRALVHRLSVELFGRGLSIADFPSRPDLTGMGLSDNLLYAEGLASKFDYRNSFYDREPRLDITEPPAALHGTLDFLISSEVFEHVRPPVERAFEGSFRLLKPGGILIVTVPRKATGETREHFPDLHEYEVVEFNGRSILVNRTADDRWQVFEDLCFHGGDGCTLEMRVFSHPSLLRHLRGAGFHEVTEWPGSCPEFGVPWAKPTELPVTARRSNPASSG
jgi:SAM-dependent methyltransferase